MDHTLTPRVSVVMAVYNGEKYLREAINSILSQTYTDFEFIIVDDGSTDSSSDIIAEYKDNRIVSLANTVNKGLIYSLNKGLDQAKGEYIIRMDADDLSAPNRIEEQVKYMDRNPEIGISGTSYVFFGDGITSKKRRLERSPLQNKANLIFFPVVAHPSVIMRKSILNTYNLRYREEYKHAEDYGLWVEAVSHTKISNLNKPLLFYRVLANSITRSANKDLDSRFQIHKKIYQKYFKELGASLNNEELKLHFIISSNSRYKYYNSFSKSSINNYLNKLNRLIKAQPEKKYLTRALTKRRISLALIDRNLPQVIFYGIRYLFS